MAAPRKITPISLTRYLPPPPLHITPLIVIQQSLRFFFCTRNWLPSTLVSNSRFHRPLNCMGGLEAVALSPTLFFSVLDSCLVPFPTFLYP